MAPQKTTELFRGDGTAEKAHTWLRTLEQTWKYDADEKEKLYRFEKGLHPGGQAEEWWGALPAVEKKDWTAVMVAFEKKWAKPKAARRAQDTVIRELRTHCLDRESLGQYVKDEDGTSVLSHVAWAETVRKLLSELKGGDQAMLLKSAVRATLPVEFRHLVDDSKLDTWEAYLKAVEDVGVDRINDAVEERMGRDSKSEDEIARWIRAHPNATEEEFDAWSERQEEKVMRSYGITPAFMSNLGRVKSPSSPRYTPPAARQSQPAPTSQPRPSPAPGPAFAPRAYQTPLGPMTPYTPWANRTATDPFGGSTVRPAPNTFAKTLFTTPLSPSAGKERPSTLSGDPARDVDLARHISQNPRTYPADAMGVQRYTVDMTTWMSQNGNNPSPDYSSFPLSPGTVAPGSRECYRCGILTNPPHFGPSACVAQNGREVPPREKNLRNMVGSILHPRAQRTPARIAQILEVPYDPFGGHDPDQPLFEDADESENGEEPAV